MIEKLKDALIIAPGIHLATCFIYLFFYYSSFSDGLVYFSSPTDIFSISLGDVAPAYIGLVIGSLFSNLMFRHPTQGNVFLFETLPPDQQDARRPHYQRMTKILNWAFIIAAMPGIIAAILYYIATGFVLYIFVSLSCQLLILSLTNSVINRFDLSKTQFDIFFFSSIMFVSLASTALQDVQREKYRNFTDLGKPWARCEKFIILRSVSTYWLVVGANNSRSLVDSECKVKFVIIESNEFVPFPKGTPAQAINRLF